MVQRGWANGTQVMVEGPGHIPMDQIEMNVKEADRDLPRRAVLRARARW
jgi:thiamine biosynthesis protein ThiC